MHNPNDGTWKPTIIGHRGASAHAPENTAPAFDLALEQGAEGVELDLQLSRDGEIVIYHDHKLAKLGLHSQHVRDYDWARLRHRDAGVWFSADFAGTSLLRLDDVLQGWASRTRLLLEIKAHGRNRRGSRDRELAALTARRLAALPEVAFNNIRVLSFSQEVLETVADTLHATGLLPPLLVRNLDSPSALRKTTTAELAHCHVACVNINAFQPADVQRIHKLGMPLYAYTVDSTEQVLHARKLGCTLLICNDPRRVRGIVAGMDAE